MKFVPPSSLQTTYNSFIQPYFDYCEMNTYASFQNKLWQKTFWSQGQTYLPT